MAPNESGLLDLFILPVGRGQLQVRQQLQGRSCLVLLGVWGESKMGAGQSIFKAPALGGVCSCTSALT